MHNFNTQGKNEYSNNNEKNPRSEQVLSLLNGTFVYTAGSM